MHATIHPDHPGHKETHHDGVRHHGVWYGAAQRHHGLSHAGMNYIVNASGTEIFTREQSHIAIGSRVTFRIDAGHIEQLAVQVEPAGRNPLAKITDVKIAPPKHKK